MKKDEGLIQYVMSVIVLMVIALLVLYSISMKKIQVQKTEIEDGITSSALAAAVIDLNEYGTYKYIRSNNGRGTGTIASAHNTWGSAEDNLLNIFRENLAQNLNLDPTTLVANEGGIIDGEVTITHFWVYNKELVECRDDSGDPIMIKDYRGRWIRQHEETDKFYVYKYDATSVGGWNKHTEPAVKAADGKYYTPKDDKVIQIGENEATGVDGAGSGEVEVTSMTIYATVEFYVKPFGYGLDNSWGVYEAENDNIDEVGRIKVRKSVVVDVQPTELPE